MVAFVPNETSGTLRFARIGIVTDVGSWEEARPKAGGLLDWRCDRGLVPDRDRISREIALMARYLIWIDDSQYEGWACSNCDWRFPLPTLLKDEEARRAYDRLGNLKFKEHACRADSTGTQVATPYSKDPTFADRSRALVMRGYKPKDAVALVLSEIALECRNDPKIMARAKADGEQFLLKIRDGSI